MKITIIVLRNDDIYQEFPTIDQCTNFFSRTGNYKNKRIVVMNWETGRGKSIPKFEAVHELQAKLIEIIREIQ